MIVTETVPELLEASASAIGLTPSILNARLAITVTVTAAPLLGRSATATGASPSFRNARAPSVATVAIRHFLKKAVATQLDDGMRIGNLDRRANRERETERYRFGSVPALRPADPSEKRHQMVVGGSVVV
jgi:hypothetical protein